MAALPQENKNDNKLLPTLWTHHYNLNFGPSFPVSNMVALSTVGDGSCYFHAIIQAYYIPYITNQVTKCSFIREVRRLLAYELGRPAKINDRYIYNNHQQPKTWHQIINRGGNATLESDPGDVPTDISNRLKLENMQHEMDSSRALDNLFDDYVSKILDKNIFVLDLAKKTVNYNIDKDILLVSSRTCVVILDKTGHYETVGLMTNGGIRTHFAWNDPFISILRSMI